MLVGFCLLLASHFFGEPVGYVCAYCLCVIAVLAALSHLLF